jgi:hypothetical protein
MTVLEVRKKCTVCDYDKAKTWVHQGDENVEAYRTSIEHEKKTFSTHIHPTLFDERILENFNLGNI